MATGKKAMLEITKMKMTPALSAEHQRKWDESRWECKMDDPERNYDKSRAHLNFEVRKGAVIAPVDKSVCIKEKVDARIAEWKAERLAETGVEPKVRSTQHHSVCLVMGGNSERMNELAFGNQVLQERGSNAHTKRMPEIEQFALDNYMALSERVGEKNIISFIVHCDEKNCHIHATITPILKDGRLSAKDMFGGSSLVAARDKMREWHDWYAAVNEKWGLERGDNIHVTGAKHRNLDEYHRELKCEIREMERTKAKEQTLLESIKADVKTATTQKEGLISMITNLENRQKDASGKLSSLEERLAAGLGNKEKILAQIELCKASLSKYEADLSDKNAKLEVAKQTLSSLTSEQEKVQLELSHMNLQIERLDSEITELESKKESVDEGKATLLGIFNKGDLAKARKKISDQEDEISQLRKQVLELQTEKAKVLKDAQAKVDEVKKSHAEQMATLQRRAQKAEAERDSLKQTIERLQLKIVELDKRAHPERYRLSSGAELLHYFIPNRMDPTLHIWTKVGNEEYDAVSYNVGYYDVKRFDDGELTIHELVNSVFDPAEQVNAKQAELLGAVLIAAMGGPAQARVGTGGGGSNSHSPWNDKDKKRGVKRG